MSYPRKFLSETHFNTTPIPLSPPSPPEVVVAEETDFVIILAALLCALICVVGLLAVARCAWLRRGLSGTGAGGGVGGGGGSRIANKGLKKKVLNSLPKYTYTSDINKLPTAETSTAEKSAVEKSTMTEKSTVVEEDCVICLTEYVDGDEIRMLPQCGHRFHVRCIDTWLGSHSSCPSCRQILAVARCRKCGEFAGGGGRDGGGYTFGKPSRAATCSSSSPTFLP